MAVAGRIQEIAREGGWELDRELREVGGIGRIKERWRWSFVPAGEREQLVLFDHGERGGRADQEVRAAILESAYGRGLYYASDASHGREIGFYDGEVVTQREYTELDEYTGLRHTLEVEGELVNGLHGVTGMQYANTGRGGEETNNARFTGTSVVRVDRAGGVTRGQPVLLAYKWTKATWEEIDSRVIGLCAYEEWEKGDGTGDEEGMFVVEWVSALRGGGLATQMLREARERRKEGAGRTELQAHVGNLRAIEYYERLGMRRCRWWGGDGERAGGNLREDSGGSLYEPREGYQMMQVGERALESALRERALHREPVAGVEYVWAAGVEGLRDAGVLQGVRAMVARVYGGEEWFVRNEGGTGRAECLYERKRGRGREVKFIVARLTGDDRWARDRVARDGGADRAWSRGRAEADDRETAAGGAAGRAGAARETRRVDDSGGNGGGKRGREEGESAGEGRAKRRKDEAAGGERPVKTRGDG